MTKHEFAKLMTELKSADDGQEVHGHIIEAFNSNDPEFNTVLDLFGQLTPRTPAEVRAIGYLMFSYMRLLALSRIHRMQQTIAQGMSK
jgi:hypothetical protein